MVLLVSSDNQQFVVDKDVAERSALIKSKLEGKNTAPHSPATLYVTTSFTSRDLGERPTASLASSFFICVKKGSLHQCQSRTSTDLANRIGFGILRAPPWRAPTNC